MVFIFYGLQSYVFDFYSEIYINNKTGQVFKEGENLVQIKLSETLETLANSSDPLKLFYEGFIAQNIINDIKEAAKEWNLTGIQLTNKLVLF